MSELKPFKPFPNSDIMNNWKKLIEFDKQEIENLNKEWVQILKENEDNNKKRYNLCQEKIDDMIKYLSENGISTYKIDNKLKKKFDSWFVKNIYDKIQNKYLPSNRSIYLYLPSCHSHKETINGVELSNNKSPTYLIELYNNIINQYNNGLKNKKDRSNLLIESIRYADENKIDISELQNEMIIKKVEEFAKNKWIENNYNMDDIIDIDCCDECNKYYLGERRCSCGNRRIDYYAEGNIIDGFYLITEAY